MIDIAIDQQFRSLGNQAKILALVNCCHYLTVVLREFYLRRDAARWAAAQELNETMHRLLGCAGSSLQKGPSDESSDRYVVEMLSSATTDPVLANIVSSTWASSFEKVAREPRQDGRRSDADSS